MIIEQFMSHYLREYDFYQELARLCSQQCESLLESRGIRAIVSFRAKRPDRLQEKIKKRNIEKYYQNVDSIYQDIADLSGVRIALYFPDDQAEVSELLKDQFCVDGIKEFPTASSKTLDTDYKKRFSGYSAKHYRVSIKDNTLPESCARFTKAIVEIQVASVLMHAWSEVEHDLVYKPLNGQLSEEEYAILDQLNGLVLAGEIGLERLQKAFKSRIAKSNSPFDNIYELTAYLYESIDPKQKGDLEVRIGSVDTLLDFLRKIDLNTPDQLKPYLAVNKVSRRFVSRQLTDLILWGNAEYYYIYLDTVKENLLKRSTVFPRAILSPYNMGAIHFFIDRIATFEYIAKFIFCKDSLTSLQELLKNIRTYFSDVAELESILALRKKIINIYSYDTNPNDFIVIGKQVEKIINDWYETESVENQRVISQSKKKWIWSIEPTEESPIDHDFSTEIACTKTCKA